MVIVMGLGKYDELNISKLKVITSWAKNYEFLTQLPKVHYKKFIYNKIVFNLEYG